jgi:hypothetical protein
MSSRKTKKAAAAPVSQITRTHSDNDRYEEMLVEFVGGPFDGDRMHVDVVRESPTAFRVLEMGYVKRQSSVNHS